MAIDLASSFQDNLNLLLTEEEMYSLTETFQQCKVIPGQAGVVLPVERARQVSPSYFLG